MPIFTFADINNLNGNLGGAGNGTQLSGNSQSYLDSSKSHGYGSDPLPDVFKLFKIYNQKVGIFVHSHFSNLLTSLQYFRGFLGDVKLEWSSKMTQCAGLCYYHRNRKPLMFAILR